MEQDQFQQHLSQISTIWTDLFQAHRGEPAAIGAAQLRLLQRYTPAVYAYLLAAVRDGNVADELFQEFATLLVGGAFKRADPTRGRFRDFLKTTLYHLVVDYQRQQASKPLPLVSQDLAPAAAELPLEESEHQFRTFWCDELMKRSWEELRRYETQTGQPLHTVLRFRVDHPDISAAQMAEKLGIALGKPVTAGWVHKRLHSARKKISDLIVEEVARSIENVTRQDLEEELLDLGLLERCRPALERWCGGVAGP
jgi:RNA polymerase sigma-70 factor (ECF subfamily)